MAWIVIVLWIAFLIGITIRLLTGSRPIDMRKGRMIVSYGIWGVISIAAAYAVGTLLASLITHQSWRAVVILWMTTIVGGVAFVTLPLMTTTLFSVKERIVALVSHFNQLDPRNVISEGYWLGLRGVHTIVDQVDNRENSFTFPVEIETSKNGAETGMITLPCEVFYKPLERNLYNYFNFMKGSVEERETKLSSLFRSIMTQVGNNMSFEAIKSDINGFSTLVQGKFEDLRNANSVDGDHLSEQERANGVDIISVRVLDTILTPEMTAALGQQQQERVKIETQKLINRRERLQVQNVNRLVGEVKQANPGMTASEARDTVLATLKLATIAVTDTKQRFSFDQPTLDGLGKTLRSVARSFRLSGVPSDLIRRIDALANQAGTVGGLTDTISELNRILTTAQAFFYKQQRRST